MTRRELIESNCLLIVVLTWHSDIIEFDLLDSGHTSASLASATMTHAACWCHSLSTERVPLLLLLIAATSFLHLPCASGSCYFPTELLGEYMMQSTASVGVSPQAHQVHQVQYSHVSIHDDAIPIWGHCHRRIGLHHAILKDSSGVQDCIRCFLLNLRSRNILQVYTEGLAKCYTTEEAAQATCPQESHTERSGEILLYKMKDLNGEPIPFEYCPINGRFTFTYNVNDGSENKVACSSAASQLHTCPNAASINIQFRRCSFEDHDITFQCLGHWAAPGPGKQRYLALVDTRPRLDGDNKPHYRCALYRTEVASGHIEMAFSSDSTCRSELRSADSGWETLSLRPTPAPGWPAAVLASSRQHQLPGWMNGRWQNLDIDINTNTIGYTDHVAFKTYVFRSIAAPLTQSTQSTQSMQSTPVAGGGRFLVFGHTLCGEELYSCLWIKERSFNVLEFQMGLRSTSSYNSTLCSDWNFQGGKWNTQGRVENIKESPCPIPGEYTGEIPDVKGLCAKLWSHCNNSETMHYTVSDCFGQQTYEERQYQCLGQWEEGGHVFTYTRRSDVASYASYECFVGKIISDSQIYIKEAGQDCQRSIDPLENGMEVTRQGPCYKAQVEKKTTIPQYTKQLMPEPTKPWKPITGRPQHANAGAYWTATGVGGGVGVFLAAMASLVAHLVVAL